MEAGIKDFEASSAWGISAPAGTPPEVVGRINAALVTISQMPDVTEKMVALGVEPHSGTPQQYTTVLQNEAQKYRVLLPQIGLKKD
jgi:tripartite-type tricarboxylate transporter receptor subunit TctC